VTDLPVIENANGVLEAVLEPNFPVDTYITLIQPCS